MESEQRRQVEANIFRFALGAIASWDDFPWHRARNGECDSYKPHSSQALCLDVFGTLKVLSQSQRDSIFSRLAGDLGLPTDGPWQVELEWCDPNNLLNESGRQRTQIDAKVTSPSALILFECKFTESGGGCCSQVKPIAKGSHRGVRQCDGTYRMQVNLANSVQARCALTGKGIRYWEVIPKIFDLQATADYTPCPFSDSAYQWMRNLSLAHQLGRDEGKRAAFVIVHTNSPTLPFTEYLKSQEWSAFIGRLRPNTVAFSVRSFNWILMAGQEAIDAEWTDLWGSLREWVQTKIKRSRAGA